MSTKPNFFILLMAQGMSVVGDSFGQRCSRVNYKHSPRHMMIGLCLMTAVQMFLIFGILQLALPTSITGAVYIDNVKVPCYYELDVEGKIMDCTPSNCTEIPCKSQGPFSMFKSIILHPFLLTNGCMNIIYYNGEVLLYKEPLGLLFLVIAALSSTFLINPFNKIFGEPINQPIPPLIYLFGITGSILSVLEFAPKKKWSLKFLQFSDESEKQSLLNGNQDSNSNNNSHNNSNNNNNTISHRSGSNYNRIINNQDDENIESIVSAENIEKSEKEQHHQALLVSNGAQPPQPHEDDSWGQTMGKLAVRSIKILIPMILLCIANALWMETSLFYNDQFRVNAFGYNSLDQILLPFYLFIFMLVVDLVKPIKSLFLSEEDSKETLWEAVKATWKETNLVSLFLYRLLINARAIVYFYLAIEYDLTLVYLELTLIRVVLNWLGAVFLNLVVPRFIKATAEERNKTFYPPNLILKCLGTVGVVVSLIILNK